jgi:hypothetical protein
MPHPHTGGSTGPPVRLPALPVCLKDILPRSGGAAQSDGAHCVLPGAEIYRICAGMVEQLFPAGSG